MTFVVPLFAVQSDQATSAQIGRIVGVKRVGEELYSLLHQPGDTTQSATTVLLTRDGNKVTYLSPIMRPGETPQPLGMSMEMSTPNLDAAFAVTESNGFAPDLRDYNGRRVVVVARAVTGAPWVLMYTVDYEEALGAADARFRTLAPSWAWRCW